MRRRLPGSRVAAILVATAVAAPGCGVSGLNFVQDDRVQIVSPEDRSRVRLPVTVAWRVRDFEVRGRDGGRRTDAGYFGVFVDRAPQPPGRTLESLAEDDPLCQSLPSCPDEEFLARLNAFSTTSTRFEIERLPAPPSGAPQRREFHEVTIVLLNGRGERIGESAFIAQFEVER